MKKAAFAFITASALYGCSDEIPMVNLGIDDVYYIPRMQKLDLHPALTGEKYEWYVDGELVNKSKDYIFLEYKEGTYNLELKILDPNTPYDFSFTINVLHEEVEYSPYISKVYEYCPAPGQFINEMPRYEEGDTYETILQKAEESISGTNDIMISLGGYGGYVTFGFDHTVINIPGEKDFRIWGNAFYELLNPDQRGGSAEPGIVMVSYDTNCNGLPDDEWYELAGSEYYKAETRHNYTITYRRPDPDRIPEEDDSGFLDDINYIPWSDSDGASGHMAKNTFHNQSYYPLWIKADNISFTGTRLAPNGIDLSGTGRYYVLYAYDWGYVDNHPNEYDELNSFDISWAVDSEGNKVHLPGVDFVRVYTGLNQYCGWLGETSTELSRAQDLHIALPGIPLPDPLE
ncbi:cell surface protein [Muribaculum intestinale]|uniref:cell surface protein n=1 Tax=Muribaculum intestinale TaxID=1796646 RepID=UPI002729829E|nr:cell surface protein [Muribaculum intestinale]